LALTLAPFGRDPLGLRTPGADIAGGQFVSC
jgi:hypothetical protein